MIKQEKTGRTFWDFVSENKILVSMLFLTVFGGLFWLVKNGTTVKTPGVELRPKQDTVFIKEPLSVYSSNDPQKQAKPLRNSPKRQESKIVKDTSVEEVPKKYENSGPGTQINIEEMKAPMFIHTPEKPYRNLTPELESDLISEIEMLIKKNNLPDKCCLKVLYKSDDKEAQNFAETIKAFLKRKSFTLVGEGVFDNHYPPYYGLKVYFSHGAIYIQVHSYD